MGILLEQFDGQSREILGPQMVAPPMADFPEKVVTCFSSRLLSRALEDRNAQVICKLDTEDGGIPVYVFEGNGKRYGAYLSRVGGPACAIGMEEVISRGASTLLMFGSCGVLAEEIAAWNLIIPTAALRDEGVSYHYLPASDQVEQASDVVDILCKVMKSHGEATYRGKVWTTDAIYRETVAKMQRRKEQGCIAVDMECASALAVARFRGVKFGQFFYTEDLLTEDSWDGRGLSHGVKEQADRLFGLALACIEEL